MQSQLVAAVLAGLDRVRDEGIHSLKSIQEDAGVSPATLTKIAAGSVRNPTAANLEQIYLSLARRGYVSTTFEFKDGREDGQEPHPIG